MDKPVENVLAILTMHIKMYALGVTCPTSPLLNVFIFAEVIQKQGDWQVQFHLNDGKQLTKPDASWLANFSCCYARKWYIPFDWDLIGTKVTETPIRWSLSLHHWQVTWPIGFMWYLGQTIVIEEGLVGKTKHYACYKNSHIFLDLIWKFKVWKSEMSARWVQ